MNSWPMQRYVVAVSGGVDSVVLLDMLVKKYTADALIVAHFDHGIRSDSADDARFVGHLATKYNLSFETQREELGPHTSEEKARERRYAFLRRVASEHAARIVTAHHADDLVETVAINLTRGTGWRGLAVLDSPDIERPLLGMTKKQLLDYAKQHQLQWREDSTNNDTHYLRNDLRQKLIGVDDEMRELLRLYRNRQVILRELIDNECLRIVGASPYKRHLFIAVPDDIGLELLRAVCVREIGVSPTRPNLYRALHAIKVLYGGKRHHVADGMTLRFTKTHFVVETDVLT